jgi:hypothetical protein
MKLAHLGDALDHWKGSVIGLIGGKNVRVVPMFTDDNPWSEKQIEAYARILRLNPEVVLNKATPFSGKTRHDYFSDLGEDDLFLDPDTGIAPDDKAKTQHISFSEIAGLLPEANSRMLLIYQHASRNKNGLRDKLDLLSEFLGGCEMFAYDSGSVGMVVISRDRDRVRQTLAGLKCWLGPAASTRIVEPPGLMG